MRHTDLSPLMRATVGFDRMMHLLDAAGRPESAPGYPPYNIEKLDENAYRITMAVAGFGEADLDLTVRDGSLVITGAQDGPRDKAGEGAREAEYLHRGIATRAFERRFELADHIEVRGARLENGLLHVELVREIPEAMKPRTIEIASPETEAGAEAARAIGRKAA